MRRYLSALLVALSLGMIVGACVNDYEVCRFEPERCRRGRPGAFCDRDSDCQGFCCKDDDNCDGGMCTFSCDRDDDCPPDMRCEHDMCFYACNSDDDCAPGQRCEHGNTVCEWP